MHTALVHAKELPMKPNTPSLLLSFALLVACGPKPDASTTDGGTTETGSSGTEATTAATTAGTSSTTDTASTTMDPTMGTGTTTSTTDPTTDPTPTGCGILCIADEPRTPVYCDLWSQDCADGEKCAAWANDGGNAWNATKCTPVMGDGVHGDPCTAPEGPVAGVDTCAKGHMCWGVDPDTNEGHCVALCVGSPEDPQCVPAGTTCPITAEGVLNLCLPTCDPLAPACPEGEICVPSLSTDEFLCVFDASEGEHPSGSPCDFVNQCNSGNACLNAEYYPHPDCMDASGCCGPYCDLLDPSCPDMPPGLTCLAWFEEGMAPDEYQSVGVCAMEP